MQKVAVGWEVYQLTQSGFHLGFVAGIQYVPLLALFIVAGHVTDTYNRKRVLMGALGLNVVADFGLAWNSFLETNMRTPSCCSKRHPVSLWVMRWLLCVIVLSSSSGCL